MISCLYFRALALVICLLSGGRNVDAFARSTAGVAVERRRQTSQTRISSASSRARSRPLYTTTTAASVDDADSQPIKYRWTRPTLDIAVPALIGMMAGEQGE